MSSKTKKPTAQCHKCGFYFLFKDLDKHDPKRAIKTTTTPNRSTTKSISSKTPTTTTTTTKTTNSSFDSDSTSPMESATSTAFQCKPPSSLNQPTMAFLKPKKILCAIVDSTREEKRKETLEEIGALGWLKYHIVLIHPETLAQLDVLPRSPAIFWKNSIGAANNNTNNNTFSKLVVFWPSIEIPQLRINLPLNSLFRSPPFTTTDNNINDLIQLRIVGERYRILKEAHFKALNLAEIEPEFVHSLSETLHFPQYLQAYLSGAFLTTQSPIEILYFGQKLLFNLIIEEDVEEKLEKLMEEMSLLNNNEGRIQEGRIQEAEIFENLPTVYKISSNCLFKINWDSEDLR